MSKAANGYAKLEGAEPVLDQRLAVVADLVDLGLKVSGRFQVDLAVDGLAADLVSGGCQRRQRAHEMKSPSSRRCRC